MSWQSLVAAEAVTHASSTLECERFGRKIARVEVPLSAPRAAALKAVVAALASDQADIVFARYPASYIDWFATLLSQGRDLLLADTLVYWRLDAVATIDAGDLPPGMSRDLGQRMTAADVSYLVGDVFADYANHYRANPSLDAAAALVGYQDWACRSAAQDPLVCLYDGHGPVGMATLAVSDDIAEVLLAGIRSDRQGRGLYGSLMAGCVEVARERGCTQLVISTQGHNTGVQRAWARLGFEPVATFATVHAVRTGLLGQA